MKRIRTIVATDQINRDGSIFPRKALQTMVDTFDPQGIPIFDNFNTTKIIGIASNPELKEGNLSVDLEVLSRFHGKGHTVVGYYHPTMKIYSIGIVKEPMDINVGYFPEKDNE